MLKKTILTVYLSILTSFLFCQANTDKISILNSTFPAPTLDNLIHWCALSTPEWEEEMNSYDFESSSQEGFLTGYYSGEKTMPNGSYYIQKEPGSMVTIGWHDYTKNPVSYLRTLINELEPCFIKYDGDFIMYGFHHNNISYSLSAHKSSTHNSYIDYTTETVMIKKMGSAK